MTLFQDGTALGASKNFSLHTLLVKDSNVNPVTLVANWSSDPKECMSAKQMCTFLVRTNKHRQQLLFSANNKKYF